MEFVFDPESEISYGWYSCRDCGREYYGPTHKDMHKKDCPTGEPTHYHFSRKEADKVLAGGRTVGDQRITAEIIRRVAPELATGR